MGDSLFKLAKMMPLTGPSLSMMFNTSILESLDRFRTYNEKSTGDPIETDEMHETNAPADQFWILVHVILFWCILLILIEWRALTCCCEGHNTITADDNDAYFKDDEEYNNFSDAGESSEVGQIVGEGPDLHVRFAVK